MVPVFFMSMVHIASFPSGFFTRNSKMPLVCCEICQLCNPTISKEMTAFLIWAFFSKSLERSNAPPSATMISEDYQQRLTKVIMNKIEGAVYFKSKFLEIQHSKWYRRARTRYHMFFKNNLKHMSSQSRLSYFTMDIQSGLSVDPYQQLLQVSEKRACTAP